MCKGKTPYNVLKTGPKNLMIVCKQGITAYSAKVHSQKRLRHAPDTSEKEIY